MKSVKIIPTIVPDSLEDIRAVSERYASFASFFQIDVADGIFAPNTTWLPAEGDSLPKEWNYEVHLMVSNPRMVGAIFVNAGARTLIVHIETLDSVQETNGMFEGWKRAGVQSIGLAVLLETPLEKVNPYLSLVDFVLLMTIAKIGVQGIPFEEESIARVAEFKRSHPEIETAVDGGVSGANIADLARAGATRFGVGSAIAKSDTPNAAYEELRAMAENALQSRPF